MATTKKSSTKNTKTTKTVKTKPSKKPATKPAGASVKPKSTKTTQTTKTTTSRSTNTNNKTVTTSAKPAKKSNRVIEVIFGILIIIVSVALLVWGAICLFCGKDKNIVQIDTGNGSQVSAFYVEVPDYDLYILIPTDFKKLSDKDLQNKYTDADSIDLAYVASDDSAAMAFTQADSQFTNDDVKTFINTLEVAAKAANAKNVETNFYEESGYSVGTIKFYDASESTYPYQYAAVFSHDDKVTLVTFEYTAAAKGQWEKVGDTIMSSLKFNQK